MYNLSNFTLYTNQNLTSNTNVLVWSKHTGYYFKTVSKVSANESIIAVEN